MWHAIPISDWIVTALYIYSAIVVISIVLMENRNPVKALSWIMIMVFLPVLGVFIYVFFGQDFRRHKLAKFHPIDVSDVSDVSDTSDLAILPELMEEIGISSTFVGTARLLNANSGARVYPGNQIDVYISGVSMFDALFYDIAQATSSIHVEFFIIENDHEGRRLQQLLIEKAKSGVEVRLIYDYLGGYRLPRAYKMDMKKAGVQIHVFAPVEHLRGFSRINYRNHRKVVVVDGKVGFIGGMNVADRYSIGDNLGLWRDTFCRMEGSAVHGLQRHFLNDWASVDKHLLTDKMYFQVPEYFRPNLVQIVPSGPDSTWRAIMQGILSILHNARHYVYIHTPYLIPPESVLTALKMSALSGVDVRILIPKRSDSPLTEAASRSYLEPLLRAGVKVYYYRNNFMHSKAIVSDDEISVIGTTNMDIRSYEQNFEVSAFIYDDMTAKALKRYFEFDLQSSELIELERWIKRPYRKRLVDAVARLFSPLL